MYLVVLTWNWELIFSNLNVFNIVSGFSTKQKPELWVLNKTRFLYFNTDEAMLKLGDELS